MSLYHKYRPTDFDEVLGNAGAVQALKTMLEKPDGERPHAYLLSGPSGCGKTTLARIAATKYLGADELSIREINTANNRGIDTAREIIDQSRYSIPSGGPVVYIIDECHSTTKDWQNAMLKPLEDAPKQVYFFLCTTDPNKLLRAVITRCSQVVVAPPPEDQLYKHLRRIAHKEGFEIPQEIIQRIPEVAQGSPRQALVMLEAVSQLKDVAAMQEVLVSAAPEQADTIDLCRLLCNKSTGWLQVAALLTKLKAQNTDPEAIRRAVLGYASACLLRKDMPSAGVVLECFAEPTYDIGFPGIVLACYQALHSA